MILEESDRYLPELFYPDMTNYYDNAQRQTCSWPRAMRACRSPLLNVAMAMLAIFAVLGGDFSRRGYAKRIAIGIRRSADRCGLAAFARNV